MAWLMQHDDAGDSYAHIHMLTPPSLEDRQHARAWLLAVPSAERLFAMERPLREGEAEEPAVFV